MTPKEVCGMYAEVYNTSNISDDAPDRVLREVANTTKPSYMHQTWPV
jgi:hypothetical protein